MGKERRRGTEGVEGAETVDAGWALQRVLGLYSKENSNHFLN